MIKFENTEVTGWEAAIRGMRNPMNSWAKSDSVLYPATENGCKTCPKRYDICTGLQPTNKGCFEIGEEDLKLMRSLAKAGTDHGKFARMINVTVDITAPFYWWKEYETYKVGTVSNSCSTMHKIAAKEFTIEDFSHEHLLSEKDVDWGEFIPTEILKCVIAALNFYRKKYLETKNKVYWWQMIQLLQTSYNQRRTVQLNYQVLWAIHEARENHKLDEWLALCDWAETLPYFKEIYM